eukprot:jgi/Bigna1/72069/fgenesh1_pg.18_\
MPGGSRKGADDQSESTIEVLHNPQRHFRPHRNSRSGDVKSPANSKATVQTRSRGNTRLVIQQTRENIDDENQKMQALVEESPDAEDEPGDEPGLYEERSRRSSRAASHKPSHVDSMRSTIRNIKVSEGIETFSTSVFLRFFFYHALFPATIPVAYLVDGENMLKNLCFIPRFDNRLNVGTFLIQLFAATAVWILIGLYATDPDPPEPLFFIIPVCLYFTHKLMVATKYAILDDATLQWLSKTTLDIEQTHSQLRYTADKEGIEIDDLCFHLHKDVYEEGIANVHCDLMKEILDFYRNLDLDGNDMEKEEKKSLSLPTPSTSKRNRNENTSLSPYLMREVQQQPAHNMKETQDNHNLQYGKTIVRGECCGMVKVPVLPIANRLVVYSLKGTNKGLNRNIIHSLALLQGLEYLFTLLSTVHDLFGANAAAIPIVVGAATDTDFGSRTSSTIVQLLCGWMLTAFYFDTALVFIDVGRIDYQRRANVIQAAGDNDTPLYIDRCPLDIFVDMAWPQVFKTILAHIQIITTLMAECYCLDRIPEATSESRVAVQDKDYDIHIGLFFTFLLVRRKFLFNFRVTFNFVSKSVLPGLLLEGEFSAVTVATVAGFLVSIGYVLGRSIWYGSATNEQFALQARSLARIQLKLRLLRSKKYKHQYHSKKKQIIDKRLQGADSLMEAVTTLLDLDSQLELHKSEGNKNIANALAQSLEF